MRTIQRSAMLIAVVALLTGCAGALGNPVASMSPEQLQQWVKQKDAGCMKITGIYMGATFTAINNSIDRGIPAGAGSVKIDDNCGITITAEPKPLAVKPAP